MIAVTGVPFDDFSSFLKGPAKAPQKIREAYNSDSSNYFTEQLINMKEAAGWRDVGDLTLPKGAGVTEAIEKGIQKILETNDHVFSLGGDHSISYPIIKAVTKKYPNLTVLHLDAHSDLYDNFEGNKYSHACPFARVMEEGLVSRLVQVGIRTLSAHLREQADKFGVEIIEMKNWNADMTYDLAGPVYLSLDMDVLDPAFAPGVSHHEPGGFSTREVLSILQKIKAPVVSADLVELNPDRDASGITAMLAGKLFKEILDLMLRTNR